jgi:hypothetical protein
MWTTVLLGHYIPVSWMTLGADYLAWGMNPTGYHLTNVLFHSANAAVFYLVAQRLIQRSMLDAVTAHAGIGEFPAPVGVAVGLCGDADERQNCCGDHGLGAAIHRWRTLGERERPEC